MGGDGCGGNGISLVQGPGGAYESYIFFVGKQCGWRKRRGWENDVAGGRKNGQRE